MNYLGEEHSIPTDMTANSKAPNQVGTWTIEKYRYTVRLEYEELGGE